jgi:probable selenium-dependent hydroxylase accessory protein YqeC
MGRLAEAFLLEESGMVSLVGAGGKTTLMYSMARELEAMHLKVLVTTTTRIYPPGRDESPIFIVEPDTTRLLQLAEELFRKGLNCLTAASSEDHREGKLKGYPPEAVDEMARSGLFDWVLVEADGAARRPLKAPAPHEPVVPAASSIVIGIAGMDAVGRPLDPQWIFRAERFSLLTGLPMNGTVEESHMAAVFLHPSGVFKGTPSGARRVVYLNKTDGPKALDRARAVARHISKFSGPRPTRIVMGSLIPGTWHLEWLDIQMENSRRDP